MERLPVELLQQIFLLATTDDAKTAVQLCLVNKAAQRFVAPLLYRHICLSGTDQVRRFNASFKRLPPKTLKLIQGMTLLDSDLALTPVEDDREDFLDKEARRKGGWIKQWKNLLRYVGHLSRLHRLCTLVVFGEVEARFRYEDDRGNELLAKQLLESNIRLQHLVLAHAHAGFFLSRIQTEKLTLFACEMYLEAADPLNIVGRELKLRSRKMKEVSILLGDNFDFYWAHTGAQEAQVEEREWEETLVRQLGEIRKTQQKKPTFKLLLHRKTPKPLKDLKKRVNKLNLKVTTGLWGKSSDTCQREAELENMADQGWISKALLIGINAPKDVVAAETSKSASQHVPSNPPGNQWCFCDDLDIHRAVMDVLQEDDEMDDSADDDDYDYDDDDEFGYGGQGYWSDDSDNWNPMQRMAYLSGESYHYSQAYIDQYAL